MQFDFIFVLKGKKGYKFVQEKECIKVLIKVVNFGFGDYG